MRSIWKKKLFTACCAVPEYPSYTTFSVLPSLQHRRLNALPKDILHLHWLGDGLLSPWALGKLRGPVVWTMHDTWPFTGGCHYSLAECERLRDRCGQCPELCSRREHDVSRLHWKMKRQAVRRLRPVMVSPSSAFARKAAQSGLLRDCRIENIPNGVDATVFKPIDKIQARAILGLPPEKPLLLFGAVNAADDRLKGFDLLLRALDAIPPATRENLSTMVFGSSRAQAVLPCPVRFLGKLHDEVTLALAYSAADIFICPSRQDNLPNTVLESLACGTPVAAFSVGGIPDMVENGVTGLLAQPRDPLDLAAGISLLLGDAELRRRMGSAGRAKVEREFALPVTARRYLALYEDILKDKT